MTPPRWPWPELAAALRAAGYRTRAERFEVLGVTQRTIDRWKADGVPDASADRAAIAIGTHPSLVWTTWHLGAPAAVSGGLGQDEAA